MKTYALPSKYFVTVFVCACIQACLAVSVASQQANDHHGPRLVKRLSPPGLLSNKTTQPLEWSPPPVKTQEQLDADASYANGDLPKAETLFRNLLAEDDHIANDPSEGADERYREAKRRTGDFRWANAERLPRLLEQEGRFSEAAQAYSHLITDRVAPCSMKTKDYDVFQHYIALLTKAGGHAAVVQGFAPVRNEKFFTIADEPLVGKSSVTYSLADLNSFGLSVEDAIDYKKALGLDVDEPTKNAEAKAVLERVIAHWPRFYEAWDQLIWRTEKKDTFAVGEREYLAADPAHRLVMKKRYCLDFAKLDREVNPAP
jgi:tetratricopeptide (TPR) repeat protein